MDLGFKNNLFSLSKNKTIDLKNYAINEQEKIKIIAEEKNESTKTSIKTEFFIPREYFGKIIGTVNLPNTISGWDTCKNALDFLQEKMSYIRKTITSWDVLNLQDTITTPTNAVEKIENLLPNSSLMVVFEDTNQSFDYNGQDYKTGDMFVKAFDGTIIPIKGAVEKGKYTPTGLTVENNTVTISYGWNTDNKNSVDLILEEFSPVQPTAYSIKEEISSNGSKEFIFIENIIPVIKFYYSKELIESDEITTIYTKEPVTNNESKNYIKELIVNDEISVTYTDKSCVITNKLPFDITVEVK